MLNRTKNPLTRRAPVWIPAGLTSSEKARYLALSHIYRLRHNRCFSDHAKVRYVQRLQRRGVTLDDLRLVLTYGVPYPRYYVRKLTYRTRLSDTVVYRINARWVPSRYRSRAYELRRVAIVVDLSNDHIVTMYWERGEKSSSRKSRLARQNTNHDY